jgi:putative ABC transport system permease protein
MVLIGAAAGCALGMASVRYIEPLLYEVHPTELVVLLIPALAMLAVALVAAIPAVIHAVKIDPAVLLRTE